MKKKLLGFGCAGIVTLAVVGSLIGLNLSKSNNTLKAQDTTKVTSAETPISATSTDTDTVLKTAGAEGVSVVPQVKINGVIYNIGDTMPIGSTTGIYTGLVQGKLALFQWVTDSKAATGKIYIYKDAESKGVPEWKGDYGIPYACRNLSSAETELVPVDILTKTNWYWLSDTHEKYTAWAFISQYKETHSIYRKDIGAVSPVALVPIDQD